jgi:hypothetical protein
MICPRCGTENRAEVRFCRHCGQRLIKETPQPPSAEPTLIPSPPTNTVCGVCGAAVKSTARFCPRCGNELPVPTPQLAPQPSATPPHTPNAITTSTGQMPSSVPVSIPPAIQTPPPQPSYSQPMEPPPPSAMDRSSKQKPALAGKEQKKTKPMSRWLWGAIIGIIIIIILIVLAVVSIPKVLKGIGLFATATATPVAEEPSPTLTITPSPTSTTLPTPTPEETAEPSPVALIPAASITLETTPETITVGSQVVVTVSLTNDSEERIRPLRCDLTGELAPALDLAEGVTYTLSLPDTEQPVEPGAQYLFTYRIDAIELGTATLSASILIEVNTSDHRQVIQSSVVTLLVQ